MVITAPESMLSDVCPLFFCFYEQLCFHMQVSWTINVVGMKESILLPKGPCPVIFWANMSA